MKNIFFIFCNICYTCFMLKKIILPALLIGTLSACSPAVPMVEFEGKEVPATTISEAKALGQNFIDVMCSVVDEGTITEAYVDDLVQVADNYRATPPVENDYENDWLIFPTMADAIETRVEALQPMIGSPVDEEAKNVVNEQCVFIQSALDLAFNDFENM